MFKEKTHNSVRMNRDTELKQGFLEVMQNKILKDKEEAGNKIWGFYSSMYKGTESM